MKIPFILSETLTAQDFTPAMSGDFWRVFLDECCLGGKRELAVYASEQAAPQVTKTENSIVYRYDSLTAENGSVHNIALTLTQTLEDGVWHYAYTVDNKSAVRLNEVQYPFFQFDRVNGDFAEDILYVPEELGRKIVNPHAATAATHSEYRGADYKNIVRMYRHPGPMSMPWVVLESGKKSLYLAFHSEKWRCFSFVTETEPREAEEECFILGLCTYPAVTPGECITYEGMTAALFAGDWRECAKHYRAWAESSWLGPIVKKDSVRDMHGWQRIILRHQHGDVFNRYEDLVRIYKEGAKYGINTILAFAWWEEGMDNGYPNYQPSDELGGAEALKKAIQEIHALGGRIFLYSNGHLIDRATEYYKTEGYRYTTKDIELNDYIEKYHFYNTGTLLKIGHKTFVAGCYGTQQWADKVEELELRQLSLGARGTFFDQLGCNFQLCFDTTHSHGNRIDEDPSLRLQAVKKMRGNLGEDDWFGTEWLTDRITPLMDFTHGCGPSTNYTPESYPYLFRYTFPECPVSQRRIHDEKEGWEKHLYYAFVHGLLFDVALWRCRIKSIDDLPNYAKKVGELIELRKQYLDHFTLGAFDILDLPEGVWGAKYTYESKSIAALWNDTAAPFEMAGQTVEPGTVKVVCLD